MSDWKRFESKSTEELIHLFQGSTLDEEEKTHSFFALFHRFKKDLLQKCEINCKRFGHGVNVAELITERTLAAYVKNGNFKVDEGKGKTVDHSFQIYLYGIARNQLTNFFKQEEKKRLGLIYDGTERIVTQLPNISLDKLSIEDKIIYETIQSLPASHRAVYLTYKAHEKVGCNLPKKLQEELRLHLGGVTQITVRGYKKEAIDKINEGLKILKLTKKHADERD